MTADILNYRRWPPRVATPAAIASVLLLSPAGGPVAVERPGSTVPVGTIGAGDLGLPGQSLSGLMAQLQDPPVKPSGARDPGLDILFLFNAILVPPGAHATIRSEDIERVEIMREGAASLYGTGASGAINVITGPNVPGGIPKFMERPTDLGYLFSGPLIDLRLSLDFLAGCDSGGGFARPLWAYTGGEPFGGPLVREYTWFLNADEQPLLKAGWEPFGSWDSRLGGGPWWPSIELGPTNGAALGSALGAPPPPAEPPAPFALDQYRDAVPPESLVLRSDACPEELKPELRRLYSERDQAWADLISLRAFRDEFGASPEAEQDAIQRRDNALVRIRELLNGCRPPTIVASPTPPPAAAPTVEGGGFQSPSLSLSLDYAHRYAPPIRTEFALDLGIYYQMALPGAGPKDVGRYAGDLPLRYFSRDGDVGFQLDRDLLRGINVTPQQYVGYWQGLGAIQGLDHPDAWSVPKDWLNVRQTDGAWSVDMRLPLWPVDSWIVELGGTRKDVGSGGPGSVPIDARYRFQPVLEQLDPKMAPEIQENLIDVFNIGELTYLEFAFPRGALDAGHYLGDIRGGVNYYPNLCADAALPDTGSASGSLPDEPDWAIRQVGITDPAGPAQAPRVPIVIGVIDTGLDWHHLNVEWDSLWRNPREIAGNGLDDDGNGYADDIIGWNFIDHDNRPWDDDGHGTFVTGLIIATRAGNAGFTGVNPDAKIMVLKALGAFGRTRASRLAKAIAYGADNGAHILNVSVAGVGMPPVVQEAIRYAESKGVLVVVAAGNAGQNIDSVFPAGMRGTMVVAATDARDRRPEFSNWGERISLAAPGVDVLSLRARRTDFMWNTGDAAVYRPGANIVGDDRRYYRSTGTSFAAPIVSGIASLVWGADPSLTAADVRRILEQSARDIEAPGRDPYTGYGLIDARAALAADPAFFIEAEISGARVLQKGRGAALEVSGTADADQFRLAWIELGAGEQPDSFRRLRPDIRRAISGGPLAEIDASEFAGSTTWTIRLVTEHRNGRRREARFVFEVG